MRPKGARPLSSSCARIVFDGHAGPRRRVLVGVLPFFSFLLGNPASSAMTSDVDDGEGMPNCVWHVAHLAKLMAESAQWAT